mmetsp:Transcript_17408/g.15620  ORF Transcript_17408/g.15620 Transcript_17408/m.15620 type:complete len:143 (-) Transcript_17408:35-463(-)
MSEIASFRISCGSDSLPTYLPNEEYVCVVIYKVDGQTKWNKNGHSGRTGYVIIKKSTNCKTANSGKGQIHGGCYKAVMGEEASSSTEKTVAGHSYRPNNNKWHWDNSGTFTKKMSANDKKGLDYAIKQYAKNGTQTTQNPYR